MDDVVLRPGMTFEPDPMLRTYRVRCEPDDEVKSLRADNAVLVAALAHEWGRPREDVTDIARRFAPTWADEET